MQFNTTYPNTESPGMNGAYLDPSRVRPDYVDPFAPSYLVPHASRKDRQDDKTLGTSEQPPSGLLEAITHDFSSQHAEDPLAEFLAGKTRFLSQSVEDMLGLLYERERIKYDHALTIDYASCQLKTRLFETGTWRTGMDPRLDRTRGQIEGELLNLEREKRMENVNCWRDVTRLKSELRETLREFDQEKRRHTLLEQPGPQ